MEISSGLVETLLCRGWCFRDMEQLKGLIGIHMATVGNVASVASMESELVNMDLRSIGGKSLPHDPEKLSHLQGPKVLQIVSTRDISLSSIEATSKSSSNRRLLRICLTDGYSEIVAIEYQSIPSIHHDDMVPGCKVRLENQAAIHNGIVCLYPKVVHVLGGLVQTLHEEWQMNRKYSGFSRSSVRPSQGSDGDVPPAFEKLQVDMHSKKASLHRTSEMIPKITVPASVTPSNVSNSKEVKGKNQNSSAYEKVVDIKEAALSDQKEEKPSSSDTRPKEVSDAVPIQNQAAAQKLLQKMNQPGQNDRRARGLKYRGKERDDEAAVFTLDEWEKRKGEVNPLIRHEFQDIRRDEELARQLQKQLDLEDQAQSSQECEAERIRRSMFNFHRMEEDRYAGRSGFRGRGRGRGRGRRSG